MDLPLDRMTVAEKVQLMEQIWDDLCRKPEQVPSPSWHRDVLDERAGAKPEEYIPWEEAKRLIREQRDRQK